MSEATGEYFVVPYGGEHCVVYQSDEAPEWWRVVARFPSHDRAEDYAEFENGLMRDFPEEPHRHDDVKEGAPALPQPMSGLTALINRPQEVNFTITEIAAPDPEKETTAKEITPEPTESAEQKPDAPIEEITPENPSVPETSGETVPHMGTEDDPDSQTQPEKLVAWLTGYTKISDILPSRREIAEATGIPRNSLRSVMQSLEVRGVIDITRDERGWTQSLAFDGKTLTVDSGGGKNVNRTGVAVETRAEQVYPWLAVYAKTSTAMPTLGQMAKSTGVPSGSVSAALDELARAGRIEITRTDGVRTAIRIVETGDILKATVRNTPRGARLKPTSPAETSIMDSVIPPDDKTAKERSAPKDEPHRVPSKSARRERIEKSKAQFAALRDAPPPAPARTEPAPIDRGLLEQPIEWLVERGFEVEDLSPSSFMVNGSIATVRELIGIANSERVKAGRSPYTFADIDPPSNGGSSLAQAL